MHKQFRIYRANKNKTGTASSWQLSFKEDRKFDQFNLFLNITSQAPADDENGNAKFNWKTEQEIIVNLADNDIGNLLSTLEGRKNECNIFHESPKGGNKTISLKRVEEKPEKEDRRYPNENAFYLNVAYKGDDKSSPLIKHSQSLTFAEASILTTLLRRALERIYDW